MFKPLCTFTCSWQTFTIFFRINAFINVYYNFLTFITSMAWPRKVTVVNPISLGPIIAKMAGYTYRIGYNVPPIGYGTWDIKRPRNRWRHATLKGQGRDPNMLVALYLENGLRYRLGYNEAPIWTGTRVIWSRDRWRPVTLKGQGCGPDYIWTEISWTALELALDRLRFLLQFVIVSLLNDFPATYRSHWYRWTFLRQGTLDKGGIGQSSCFRATFINISKKVGYTSIVTTND